MAISRALMQLRPIVAALGRHKVATLLIVLQVALTLAVASNALFMVATRIVHLSRSTGIDEAHLFVIRSSWAMGLNAGQIDANIRTDLDALRHVAGVRDVVASNSYPLGGNVAGMLTTRLKLKADQTTRPQFAMVYAADEHALDTLGISLIAGRNFRPEEISTIGPNDKLVTPGIIVTRDIADKLFPAGSALGRTVYLPDGPTSIIGIVADLQGPLSVTRSSDADSALIPARYVDPDVVIYLVRTDGTAMNTVMSRAMQALQQRPGVHVIDPKLGVFAMAAAREQAYATDHSVAMLMSIVCGLLLLATAGGIVGLSSFWVSQRRRQIGIRRSLGATSGDILRYFHAENFLIVSSGILLGIALALLANFGLMEIYELPHMPLYVPLLGALLLWLIGQLAVWGPARYAARVAPVVAIRTT